MAWPQREFHKHAKQQGAALMIMLVIMVLGTVAFLVSSLNSSTLLSAQDRASDEALAQAKAALIGYAATYGDINPGDVHGYLPCPDEGQSVTQDGEANGSCGATDVSRIGKLPWRTLGLQPLKDGNGECLWYAVSGTYKYNPKTLMMNDDTIGLLSVMASDGLSFLAGSSIDNRAVAVIFAPGAVQSVQSRTAATGTPACGGNYTASNYLDHDTIHNINNAVVSTSANTVSQFISGPIQAPGDTSLLKNTLVNDRMIVITKSDIFNAIQRRADFVDPSRNPLLLMTQKAAACIADYGRRNRDVSNNINPADKRLPWSGRPAPAIGTDCTYRDSSTSTSPIKVTYGRLPNRVSVSDSATNNQIDNTSCTGSSDSKYQLRNNNCPSVANWSTYYPWWSNWKDHVFYTLAKNFRPDASSSTPACNTSTCLKVNNSGLYAAVVIFSGGKLSSQTRATDVDKINFSNYLEGNNFLGSTPISASGADSMQSGTTTNIFNDSLFCINPNDLTVSPC